MPSERQTEPSARGSAVERHDEANFDRFVKGYLLGWLFFEPLPPPDDDEDWYEGASYLDGGNFTLEDLTDTSRRNVCRHCKKIFEKIADLVPGNRSWHEGSEFEHAGHDAAITSQELGEGFDRSEWNPTVRKALVAACHEVGALFVEPSRGRIHVR